MQLIRLDKEVLEMKLRSPIVIAFVGLAALALAQDQFLLRRELKEGAKDTYKISTKVSQIVTPSDPNQASMLGGEMKFDMSMTMDMAAIFKKISEDKKSAEMEMSFNNIVYDFGTMSGMVPTDTLPKSMKALGKIDERSRLSEFKFPDLPTQFGSGAMVGPMMVELPERQIKVGDMWEMPLPTAEQLGAKDGKMIAKLLALEDYETIPVYVVDLTASLPIDADLGKMAEASGAPPMKIIAKGTFGMKGKAHVERATGKTLRMELTFDSKSHLTMPEVGVELDSSGIGTSLVQIVLPK